MGVERFIGAGMGVIAGILCCAGCVGSEPSSAVVDETPNLPATPNTNAAVSAAPTCESLTASRPLATLNIVALPDDYDVGVVDAYALDEDGALTLVLSNVTNARGYREEGFARSTARELRVRETTMTLTSGCNAEADAPIPVHGSLSITAQTETDVTGTFDVTDALDRRVNIRFRVPLSTAARAGATTCCAR